jgi:hypothetical protein
MKKSTTWRVRALGVMGTEVAYDTTAEADAWSDAQVRDATPAAVARWVAPDKHFYPTIRDFQIARLETIVSGPTVLAARMPAGTFRGGDPARPAGLRVVSYHNDEARYYRTIIDTREWITRPWSDPASAKRWHELSEKE